MGCGRSAPCPSCRAASPTGAAPPGEHPKPHPSWSGAEAKGAVRSNDDIKIIPDDYRGKSQIMNLVTTPGSGIRGVEMPGMLAGPTQDADRRAQHHGQVHAGELEDDLRADEADPLVEAAPVTVRPVARERLEYWATALSFSATSPTGSVPEPRARSRATKPSSAPKPPAAPDPPVARRAHDREERARD